MENGRGVPKLPAEYADQSPEWINGYLQGLVNAYRIFNTYLEGVLLNIQAKRPRLGEEEEGKHGR